MDGKGRCMDNIFVERLWRSLKYEEVYLHAYASVAEAKAGIVRSPLIAASATFALKAALCFLRVRFISCSRATGAF
jgi:transposase InsO family protein